MLIDALTRFSLKALIITTWFEFFTINTKLPEMAISASKGLAAAAARILPPVGFDLIITGSRDYHWSKSLLLNQLS